MAGGVKKPVNIFRLRNLGEPDGVFNWRLWFAVASFALLGAARGIDEGLIAGAFNSPAFKRGIRYDSYSLAARANIKANVSSMVQLGSVAGAFFAFVVCDRLGRIQATRFLCMLWIVGIVIFMVGGAHGNLGAIYAGRLIAGLGVGQTPVVGPIYIAEIAPASVRGLCTCFFTGAVYLGIVLAYFANYGASQHIPATSHRQWLVPTSLHVVMAGLILVLMFFQRESPRFLARSGRDAAAARNLARLRRQPVDGAYVTAEMGAVRAALDRELEVSAAAATSRRGRLAAALRELLCDGANLYRLYLATAAQLLSQWSGAGSVTLYAVDFFRILGVAGRREGLLVTAVFGLVKLVAACVCALFLVDVIGRKRSLILGIALQAISMTYIAGFLSALPQLGVVDDFVLPASAAAASRAAIAMVYLSGIGWALGWNSMQYLLTAELFPLRVRALATSWAMTLHFANQYGSSRAVPVMLLPDNRNGGGGGIAPRGTFWFFAAVTILGGFWVLVSVPETAGRDLESMDRLFRLPWYKIGLHGNRDAERRDNAAADDTADAVEMRDDKADGGARQRYGVGGATAEHIEEKKTPHSVAVL